MSRFQLLLKQQWNLVMSINYKPGRVGVVIMRRLMVRPLSQRFYVSLVPESLSSVLLVYLQFNK